MKVKYLDLPEQFSNEALRQAVLAQFDQCQFVGGPEIQRFETRFADLCRVPFAVGLNSGTDAIFLALKALGIGKGDEVITVPNSFLATAGAVVAAGAKPVFVDVTDDYNMDASKIEDAVTGRTRAVLPVHLTGNPADMPAIMRVAKAKGLYVVEDAAQAVSAEINGQPVGSFGDAGCFSLHPLKNLNAAGDGGVLTTSSSEIAHRVTLLRNHGLRNRDEIEFFGYNSRLDSIQAAVANHVLDTLGDVTNKRIENARLYDQGLAFLSEFVTLPPRRSGSLQVFHTYVIRAKNRDNLISFLSEKGIETKIHYPIPIHLQRPCLEMGYKMGDFPICEEQASEIVTLPVHQHLSQDQILYVTEQIASFYGVTI
jgi:dTDP-4-amino-4,6-dideoxygalactose transaminase